MDTNGTLANEKKSAPSERIRFHSTTSLLAETGKRTSPTNAKPYESDELESNLKLGAVTSKPLLETNDMRTKTWAENFKASMLALEREVHAPPEELSTNKTDQASKISTNAAAKTTYVLITRNTDANHKIALTDIKDVTAKETNMKENTDDSTGLQSRPSNNDDKIETVPENMAKKLIFTEDNDASMSNTLGQISLEPMDPEDLSSDDTDTE